MLTSPERISVKRSVSIAVVNCLRVLKADVINDRMDPRI